MAAVAENITISGDHPVDQPESDHQSSVQQLVEMLSKLNPDAKEFIPSCAAKAKGGLSADAPLFNFSRTKGGSRDSSSDGSSQQSRRKRNNFNSGWRRSSDKLTKAEKEDKIRRTVYVSDIDNIVTESELTSLFGNSGVVNECRVCGDPNTKLRFAFLEFSDENGASAALNYNNVLLGSSPLKVLPSKTAIQPVNELFRPQSEAEKEMCARTIYCTNIDKKVTQKDVKDFFETVCGQVIRLRLLGDNIHTTRIAFIEFSKVEDANEALNHSGLSLGSLPIRVSSSKTPVRPRTQNRGTSP